MIGKKKFIEALTMLVDHPEPCSKCVVSFIDEKKVRIERKDACYWCFKLVEEREFSWERIKKNIDASHCPCFYLGKEEALSKALEVIEEYETQH